MTALLIIILSLQVVLIVLACFLYKVCRETRREVIRNGWDFAMYLYRLDHPSSEKKPDDRCNSCDCCKCKRKDVIG